MFSALRKDPVYALIAVFPLLFPAYLWRFTLAGIPLTFTELVLVFLAAAFCVRAEVWKPSFWKVEMASLPWISMGLFVLAALISVWVSPDLRALGILKGWILLPMLYGIMARTAFRAHPSWISASVLAAGISGLFLIIFGHFKIDGRFAGPFESANYLALYLGPIVAALLFLTDRGIAAVPRWILISLVGVLGLGLVLSQSYAAFVGLWLVILVHELTAKPFKPARMSLFVGLSIAAFLALILSPLGDDKWAQFLDWNHRSSTSVRLEIYQIARSLIAGHPILGIGLGQFEVQYPQVAVAVLGHVPMEWVMLHPHNLFLALELNLGLLGLGSFVALLRSTLTWLRERDVHFRYLGAFMILQILLHGLFDTPYFKNDLAFLFWWAWAFFV